MTELDYQALGIMSVAVWRFIAAIRTPILTPIRGKLVEAFTERGEWLYSAIVWTIAFVAAYLSAMFAGENGDMLRALEWAENYPELGWALTAALIASGSAGLRVAEKMFVAKINGEAPNA